MDFLLYAHFCNTTTTVLDSLCPIFSYNSISHRLSCSPIFSLTFKLHKHCCHLFIIICSYLYPLGQALANMLIFIIAFFLSWIWTHHYKRDNSIYTHYVRNFKKWWQNPVVSTISSSFPRFLSLSSKHGQEAREHQPVTRNEVQSPRKS